MASDPVSNAALLQGLGNAPMTITLAQLQGLQGRINELALENAALLERVAEAERADPKIRQMDEAFTHALAIVSFAVGNLPPPQNPNFPWQALSWLAENIRAVPGRGETPQEIPILWRRLAEEYEKWWRAEKEGGLRARQELLRAENAARSTGTAGGILASGDMEGELVHEDGGK